MVVLFRHGLRRCWASVLVKISAFTGLLPMLITITAVALITYLAREAGAAGDGPSFDGIPANDTVRSLFDWQFWGFVSLFSLGAGAGVISRDRRVGAFQFYFAKPVTPTFYLAGRISAVALCCFLITAIPTLITAMVVIGVAEEGSRVSQLWVVPAAILYSLTISLVIATLSVAVSASHKSRAFTMTGWILLLLLPHVLGSIVDGVAMTAGGEGWPWLLLGSVPALLGVIGDAFLQIEPERALRWYHAAPMLIGIVAGSLYALNRSLRDEEVIV